MTKISNLPRLTLLCLLAGPLLTAQIQTETDSATLTQVLERLQKLEKQNQEMTAQIDQLRAELRAANTSPAKDRPANDRLTSDPPASDPPASDPDKPSLEERVAVAESRIDEHAQSKVEAAHRSPIRLTGLVLFNAFANNEGQSETPPGSVPISADRAGATLNQTLLGFDFNGPGLPGGGQVTGSLNLDFFGGLNVNAFALHIRRATIDLDWKRRSIAVGQDKALISARQPDSLAEVGYPPLSSSGNPWLWVPQVRYTEHIPLSEGSGMDAQASVLETSEEPTFAGSATTKVDPTRPAAEGRINYWEDFSGKRFEIAAGFHASDSHIQGVSVPSRFGTIDWLVKPVKWLQLTGLIAGGENLSVFGGFSDAIALQPVTLRLAAAQTVGGWTQAAFALTPRLTLNLFGGLQAPRNSGLFDGAVTHANTYASNLIYRLTPNVLLGAEALQQRYGYRSESHAIGNHYDLSIGYLF